MTTELILLLGLFAFIMIGGFLGNKGPKATFLDSGPRLAARIEKNIQTGIDFKNKNSVNAWNPPPGAPPDGSM